MIALSNSSSGGSCLESSVAETLWRVAYSDDD